MQLAYFKEDKMEEKDMIFLDYDNTQSFVLVEKNKKRQKEKQKQALKKGFVLLLLLALVFGAIKLFPYAKELVMSMINEEKNDTNTPSTDAENGNTNENDGKEPTDSNNGGSGTNSDTPPTKPKDDTDSETEDDTETDVESDNTSTDKEDEETIKEGHYKINDIGSIKYVATNESGCEFDFSVKFSKTTLDEIYKKYGNDSPVVLITHSSVLETYSDGKSYSTDGAFYAENENVGDIGEVICNRLNALGIGAIQLNELYASGAIYSSQAEYKKSLDEALKKYPSISYVFNVSRDVNVNDDLTMNKSYITKNGEKYAQITLTSGTSWDTASSNQTENIRFAFDFSKFLNTQSQNFVKENTISRYPLSQNIDPLTVNVDIGDYANSYEEATRAAELFAQLFCKYITE